MLDPREQDWATLCTLLPEGWKEAARTHGAFRRARYLSSPEDLLRMLLFHAVSGGGLRTTVDLARAAGVAEMSQVALLKRLRTSGDWLAWIARSLCAEACLPKLPRGVSRLRAVDSTTLSEPGSDGTDWRVHYSLNLETLDCDWHELTDRHGGELLERTPMQRGDLLLADRNYLRPQGLHAAVRVQANVLIRLRWTHVAMTTPQGRPFRALPHARRLRSGRIGDWPVVVAGPDGHEIAGRVIALRLPRPIAEQARKRVLRRATRKQRKPRQSTLDAAGCVMIFTTMTKSQLSAQAALGLYRCRWQIELAFKRLKQLLVVGRLPHRDARAARSWILAKLVVALLVEKLLRNARSFSPWGYDLSALSPAA